MQVSVLLYVRHLIGVPDMQEAHPSAGSLGLYPKCFNI